MENLNLRDVKSKIERMRCPKCGKNPKISITSSSRFTVDCCCDSFKKTVESSVKNEIAKQAKQSIEKQLKGMFK